MVVHDEAEVRVNSHGDEDAALQHPLPTERGGGHLALGLCPGPFTLPVHSHVRLWGLSDAR